MICGLGFLCAHMIRDVALCFGDRRLKLCPRLKRLQYYIMEKKA